MIKLAGTRGDQLTVSSAQDLNEQLQPARQIRGRSESFACQLHLPEFG